MNQHDPNQASAEQGHELQQALKIDTAKVHSHLDNVVRQSVEQTIPAVTEVAVGVTIGPRRLQQQLLQTDAAAEALVRRLKRLLVVKLLACVSLSHSGSTS